MGFDDLDDAMDSDSGTGESTELEDVDSGTGESDESVTPASNTNEFDPSEIPLWYRRDTVKEERDSVHQLFVLEETDRLENDVRRKLEDAVDRDLYKLDAREAIYRAGMKNLGDAIAELEGWGYEREE